MFYDQSFVPVLMNYAYDQQFLSKRINFAYDQQLVSTYMETRIGYLAIPLFLIKISTCIMDIFTRSGLLIVYPTGTLTSLQQYASLGNNHGYE